MDDYSQPDFYRFNSDSLKLVDFVCQRLRSAHSILDMGAGSGIIGIELTRRLKARRLTLLELQNEFEVHLRKNAEFYLDEEVHCEINLTSFKNYSPKEKFDLIVSNPPYYLPGKGELSPDSRRAHARSFLEDDWNILIHKMKKSLKVDGLIFIVVKLDQKLQLEISGIAKNQLLELKAHVMDGLMILELFALNEN